MRESPCRINKPAATVSPSESEYSFILTRVAMAQICRSIGFKGVQNSALNVLTDIGTRYLESIAKLAAASANSTGRTQSNLPDIIVALEDLASVQGFIGSSSVRARSLYSSAVIKDLMKFVKYADEIPFARPLPPSRDSFCLWKHSRNGGLSYNEGGFRHVPRWLPVVPMVEEREQRKNRASEVKLWGCLEEIQEENTDWKTVEMETSNEIEVSGKRGKVRFKLGVPKTIDNPTNLRGVGIRKRDCCE